MRVLMRILFTLILMAGMGLAVAAQKDGQQKPPPKENAPKVNPKEKPPPPPKNDKSKKPGMAMEIVIWKEDSILV